MSRSVNVAFTGHINLLLKGLCCTFINVKKCVPIANILNFQKCPFISFGNKMAAVVDSVFIVTPVTCSVTFPNYASWLSFVVYNCEFVTFPLVSWVRCGT